MSDATTRSFTMSIHLDAPAELVWQALTDPVELVRWFPLSAEVEPGVGGSVLWSWGGDWTWVSRIDAWDPARRLRLCQQADRPFDLAGHPLPAEQVSPAQIAMEFTLETDRGTTRLHLVHSGFGHGSAWDDEYDGISAGWQFELRSLRHYLQHHRGRNRHVARAQTTTTAACSAAWTQLLAPFGVQASPLATGQPYTFRLPQGESGSGQLELVLPGRELLGTVRELGDGIFRLGAWRADGLTGVQVWLTAYHPEFAARLDAFAAQAQAVLNREFATQTVTAPPAVAATSG